MKKIAFFTLICSIATLLTCKKSPDPTPVKEDFSCVKLYDDNGQDVGFHGCTASDDWTFQTLTTEEAGYFIANDIITLEGTTPVQITGVSLSPIPVVQGSSFFFHLLSPSPGNKVKLQLAIIDEYKNVIANYSQKLDANGSINVMVPAEKYTRGAYYRVYYRVSALGAPVQFEGHGNIVICKQPGNFNVDTDCI